MGDGFLMRMLARMEKRLYRSADRIVTVTEPLRARIAMSGVAKEKIGVVPNGANLARLAPRTKSAALMQVMKLEGRFVVGYVGTHGMAQGLETVLRAARLMQGSDVHFLFVGEGARRKALMSMARVLELDNVTFTGGVPSHIAVEHLALADAIVIPLKKSALFEGALPSKIFEAAAMERPIIISAEGISAETVQAFGAGVVASPGDPEALAHAIRRLMASPALREQCRHGCRALARAHDRDHLATLMLNEIRVVADIRMPEKRRLKQRLRRRQRKAAMAREEFPQAGNF
jgi:glycosyltransferase involved in cell wall biosynthesis